MKYLALLLLLFQSIYGQDTTTGAPMTKEEVREKLAAMRKKAGDVATQGQNMKPPDPPAQQANSSKKSKKPKTLVDKAKDGAKSVSKKVKKMK